MERFRLERLRVEGWKSLEEAEVTFRPINVLIGPNGSGKSNLIGLFEFLHAVVHEGLERYVLLNGGANQLLHYGSKATQELGIELVFQTGQDKANGYRCRLVPTAEDSLVFQEEEVSFHDRTRYAEPYDEPMSFTHRETLLPRWRDKSGVARYVLDALRSWRVYHFHDTSDSARVKLTCDLNDNLFLRADASNLAAYLYMLRHAHQDYYENIVATVQLAAPFFGDFVLEPEPINPQTIRLRWRERGSDMVFGAHVLSDGTLRFLCLATLFLQPPDRLPATILLDEPELGLHPYAVSLLADLIRSASQTSQVVLATQSVTLVNQFAPEDILVVDRIAGKTHFRRLSSEELASWLEDYALGELWEKNLLGGRPG